MSNLNFLKGITDNKFIEAIEELSKDDMVIQKVLEKSTDLPSFINSIIAALICIVGREKQLVTKFNEILKSNPEFEKIMETTK